MDCFSVVGSGGDAGFKKGDAFSVDEGVLRRSFSLQEDGTRALDGPKIGSPRVSEEGEK
jgi:hypothetical protein